MSQMVYLVLSIGEDLVLGVRLQACYGEIKLTTIQEGPGTCGSALWLWMQVSNRILFLFASHFAL